MKLILIVKSKTSSLGTDLLKRLIIMFFQIIGHQFKGILLHLPVKIIKCMPLFCLTYVKVYLLCLFCFLLPAEIAMIVKTMWRCCCRATGHGFNPKYQCFFNYMNKLQLIGFNVIPSLKFGCCVL